MPVLDQTIETCSEYMWNRIGLNYVWVWDINSLLPGWPDFIVSFYENSNYIYIFKFYTTCLRLQKSRPRILIIIVIGTYLVVSVSCTRAVRKLNAGLCYSPRSHLWSCSLGRYNVGPCRWSTPNSWSLCLCVKTINIWPTAGGQQVKCYRDQISDLLLSGNKTRHPNAKTTTIVYIWQRIIILYCCCCFKKKNKKKRDGMYFFLYVKNCVFYFGISVTFWKLLTIEDQNLGALCKTVRRTGSQTTIVTIRSARWKALLLPLLTTILVTHYCPTPSLLVAFIYNNNNIVRTI